LFYWNEIYQGLAFRLSLKPLKYRSYPAEITGGPTLPANLLLSIPRFPFSPGELSGIGKEALSN
jgi:hypothetical protein